MSAVKLYCVVKYTKINVYAKLRISYSYVKLLKITRCIDPEGK